MMTKRLFRMFATTILSLMSLAVATTRAEDPPILEYGGDEVVRPPMVWGNAEYLLWWVKGSPLPPLLTTGPGNVLGPNGLPGTIGQPGTQVLLGGENIEFGPFSGGRFGLGVWFTNCQSIGLEGNFLFLGEYQIDRTYAASGLPGSTPLSIPFQNPVAGAQDSTSVALPQGPNPFSGAAELNLDFRLHSADMNFVFGSWQGEGVRVEALVGARYFGTVERLNFRTSSSFVPPLAPDVFLTFDRFHTTNDFVGGQIGLRGEVRRGNLVVKTGGKLAVGNMHQITTIYGGLATNDFTNLTAIQTFPGGYLALPTNIGKHNRNRISLLPEFNLNLGWQVTHHINVNLGYTFLYVTNVARVGDQIDPVINPSQGTAFIVDPNARLVGPARPQFPGRDSDFFAHGLNIGLELSF